MLHLKPNNDNVSTEKRCLKCTVKLPSSNLLPNIVVLNTYLRHSAAKPLVPGTDQSYYIRPGSSGGSYHFGNSEAVYPLASHLTRKSPLARTGKLL